MKLDQLIQYSSSLKETNLRIQLVDLDALRESFQLHEKTPIDLPSVFLVFHSLKKKHKKNKDKDKEHNKHKYRHKDRSKEKDKEKKKDRTDHHDSGADLSSGWRTWRNMARPFCCFVALAQG
ncbi:hypothetical protein CQW23_29900 [Capsicum baccatum]|uniref:Mediator of RNA polymerase II transcription subunit 19a n=1 Tax=Capsicum baccatum TaxID=33114 RepID=A0A2G2VC03_CAPBA|nr:hypothetical protein CQW23_29900 [Capsicum baccatum]